MATNIEILRNIVKAAKAENRRLKEKLARQEAAKMGPDARFNRIKGLEAIKVQR